MTTSAKKIIVLNDQVLQSHDRTNEPPDLAPWRKADDLIKQGKVQEAAEVIMREVDPKAPPRHSTLVIRVMLYVYPFLNGNGWDDADGSLEADVDTKCGAPATHCGRCGDESDRCQCSPEEISQFMSEILA